MAKENKLFEIKATFGKMHKTCLVIAFNKTSACNLFTSMFYYFEIEEITEIDFKTEKILTINTLLK